MASPMEFPDLITDNELKRLILSLGMGMPAGFLEDDAVKIHSWAHETRAMCHILKLVLEGSLLLSLKDGEVALQTSSPEQQERLREMFRTLPD